MRKPKIFAMAKKLAIKYNSNPYNLIEDLGITLKFEDFIDFSGCCAKINDKEIIVVNNNLSKLKKIYVISHEIAHLILHKEEIKYIQKFSLNESKIETEANYFATIFLSESEEIFEEDFEIIQIINIFK